MSILRVDHGHYQITDGQDAHAGLHISKEALDDFPWAARTWPGLPDGAVALAWEETKEADGSLTKKVHGARHGHYHFIPDSN